MIHFTLWLCFNEGSSESWMPLSTHRGHRVSKPCLQGKGETGGREAGTHSICTAQSLFHGLVTVTLCDVCACVLSRFGRVQLCATPRTVAHQGPLSVEFSRQEYCSGWPCPAPGSLPDSGTNLGLLTLVHLGSPSAACI